MRLSRGNGGRFSSNIWPGYVDAVTTLLMVIMFALTIAMVVQAVLREQITDQGSQLDELGAELAALSGALSTSQSRAEGLDRDLAAARDSLNATTADLDAAQSEIESQTTAAELAASRRAALEALLADLRKNNAETASALGQAQTALTEAEAARLADAAAAELLQKRLDGSQAELSAMTMRLEDERRKAEETLTILAAAEAAKAELGNRLQSELGESEKQAALLALAQQKLSTQEALSTEDQRRVALLNQQVGQLTGQLGALQAVLDAAGEEKKASDLRIGDLGEQLNIALLRAAEEERKRGEAERMRSDLERAAREKAEAEAADLSRYRSEFFGRLSQILQGREGVQVVGDRFVFSSEVLFPTGEATLSDAGRDQIRNVTGMLSQISGEIPPEIDWIIRVDGHTDNQPLSGQGRFRDNWELSQARALAVVRFMVDDLGFPANRLAATGFGDTRPVAAGDSDEARAQNRRIELKLTER